MGQEIIWGPIWGSQIVISHAQAGEGAREVVTMNSSQFAISLTSTGDTDVGSS
jgi:hypothetical protein